MKASSVVDMVRCRQDINFTWRDNQMSKYTVNKAPLQRYLLAVCIIVTVLIIGLPAFAQDSKQQRFKSPEAAFAALTEAAKTNDVVRLLVILGPQSKDIISSGDAVADSNSRKRFVSNVGEGVSFSKLDDDTALALIGKDAYSFPIPIVRSGGQWVFATEEGKQEILNRRIGRNELSVIQVSKSYVNAQREYIVKDRDGSGVLQYAQRFISHEGTKDGLYWKASAGEESSPLGPLFEKATEEGYTARKQGEKHKPYHGYYFRILKGQGKYAPGGELDYVVNGKMTGGFGLLAYPAEHGVSGIMTFLVNRNGTIYEKDLGPKTDEIAKTLTKYNPDETWKIVNQIP
jgi:hypothetical protein